MTVISKVPQRLAKQVPLIVMTENLVMDLHRTVTVDSRNLVSSYSEAMPLTATEIIQRHDGAVFLNKSP